MTLPLNARRNPDKIAVVFADGRAALTFAELDSLSARLAMVLRDHGVNAGDRVALLMGNCLEYFVACWACRRSGLRWVPVNWHLVDAKVRYIIDDSDAVAVIADPQLAEAHPLPGNDTAARFVTGAVEIGAFEPLDPLLASALPLPEAESREGAFMFYSSGTTGHPKGILRPLPETPFGQPSRCLPSAPMAQI